MIFDLMSDRVQDTADRFQIVEILLCVSQPCYEVLQVGVEALSLREGVRELVTSIAGA